MIVWEAIPDENGRPSTQVSCAPASGSTFALGITTVTCTSAENKSGTFNVTVVDTTGPVLALPNGITVKATSAAGASASYNAAAVDAVDGPVSVSCAPASGSTFPVGSTTVQCSSSDSRNNSSSGSFTITVTAPPAPPPPPQLPGDLTKEATGPDGAVVTYTATGSGGDDENGRPTNSANCSPASGSKFPLGETHVQCDGGSFKVRVVDTTAPSLNLPRDFSVPGSDSGAVVNFHANAHDLVDGSVAVSCAPASGSHFPTGATTVQCTSSDARNNSASGSFTVTVLQQPPPPPPLADMTREATGPNGAVVTFSVPGSGPDDENGRPTQGSSCTPLSGSTFPLGETTVQCTVGSFKVTIVDTTAPALLLPDNIITTDPVVHYTVSALDLVDGAVALTCTPPSGSTFAEGSTVVQCSASDTRGNSASGSFVVTVQHDQQSDTEAPVIVSIAASPDSIKPPNGKMVDVTITVGVTDNLDPQPLVRIFDVEANEPIANDDTNVTGLLTLQLRASRDPQKSGRVYTVWIEAIDAAGNRSTGSVTVTVPHDQGGSTSQPASTTPTPGKRRSARH